MRAFSFNEDAGLRVVQQSSITYKNFKSGSIVLKAHVPKLGKWIFLGRNMVTFTNKMIGPYKYVSHVHTKQCLCYFGWPRFLIPKRVFFSWFLHATTQFLRMKFYTQVKTFKIWFNWYENFPYVWKKKLGWEAQDWNRHLNNYGDVIFPSQK